MREKQTSGSSNSGTWQALIAGASTVGEVVAVAQEFVATFGSNDLANLPPDVHPGRLHDADDITAYAYELMRCHRPSDAAGDALDRLSVFFSQAATRIAELSAPSSMRERLLRLFG